MGERGVGWLPPLSTTHYCFLFFTNLTLQGRCPLSSIHLSIYLSIFHVSLSWSLCVCVCVSLSLSLSLSLSHSITLSSLSHAHTPPFYLCHLLSFLATFYLSLTYTPLYLSFSFSLLLAYTTYALFLPASSKTLLREEWVSPPRYSLPFKR